MDEDLKIVFDSLKEDIKEIKEDNKDIKKSIKGLYEDRNKLEKQADRTETGLKRLEKDLNNLGGSIRVHNETSDDFRDDVNKIRWQMNIITWVSGIVISAVLLYVVKDIIKLLGR